MYIIQYKKSVEKDLSKITRQALPVIVKTIQGLQDDPKPAGSSKLKGTKETFRIRIGDYRVIYKINNGELIILIIRIAHRREIYKNL